MIWRKPIRRGEPKSINVEKDVEVPIFGNGGVFPYKALERRLQFVQFPIRSESDLLYAIGVVELNSNKGLRMIKAAKFMKKISDSIIDSLKNDFPFENAETLINKIRERDPKITVHISGKGKV